MPKIEQLITEEISSGIDNGKKLVARFRKGIETGGQRLGHIRRLFDSAEYLVGGVDLKTGKITWVVDPYKYQPGGLNKLKAWWRRR